MANLTLTLYSAPVPANADEPIDPACEVLSSCELQVRDGGRRESPPFERLDVLYGDDHSTDATGTIAFARIRCRGKTLCDIYGKDLGFNTYTCVHGSSIKFECMLPHSVVAAAMGVINNQDRIYTGAEMRAIIKAAEQEFGPDREP